MKIKTTSPELGDVDNKEVVMSQMKDLTPINWADATTAVNALTSQQRTQLARMYYHAKLTKNWDVLGVDASNIMKDAEGNLVQMDTGGSFEFRAQGKPKEYNPGVTDTDLLNPTLPSGKVFTALLKHDPIAFNLAHAELGQLKGWGPIFNESGLANAEKLKQTFAKRVQEMTLAPAVAAKPITKPVPAAKPSLEPTHTNEEYALKQRLMSANPDKWPKKGEPGYLDSNQRLRAAAKLAYESDGQTASRLIAASIKVPPPPITSALRHTVSSYVGSSTALNQALRQTGGNLETIQKTQPSLYDRAVVLDKGFSEARDYSMPVKVMRGMPSSALPADIKPGTTFVDHGYQSTSFSGSVAKSFGSQNTVLRVTLPKGFKFLAVPAIARAVENEGHSFSQHASSEAECILPRGVGYQVKKIEKEGALRVLHVHAIFSAIQPPGTPWMSTRSAMAKLKKQSEGPY